MWVPPRGDNQHSGVHVTIQGADRARIEAAEQMIRELVDRKYKRPQQHKTEPVDDMIEQLNGLNLQANSNSKQQSTAAASAVCQHTTSITHGADAEQSPAVHIVSEQSFTQELPTEEYRRISLPTGSEASNESPELSGDDSDDDLPISMLHARGYYSGMTLGGSDDEDDSDSSSEDEVTVLTPARRARDSRVELCSESDADESDEDETIGDSRGQAVIDPYSMELEELQQTLQQLGTPASKIGRSRLVLQGLLKNTLKASEQSKAVESKRLDLEPSSGSSGGSGNNETDGTLSEVANSSGIPEEQRLATLDSNVVTNGPSLDLNRACHEDLTRIPSIGPSKAEAIIAWRGLNGGFAKLQDVQNVAGIGRSAYNILRAHCHVE